MTAYLVALTALMLVAVAGVFAAPESLLGCLRLVPMVAAYPLFVAMAVTEGVGIAGLWWLACASVGLLLVVISEARVPRGERAPILRVAGVTALLWPLVIPGTMDHVLIRLGVAPRPADPVLPEPARGAELMGLPDDPMLVDAWRILAGHAALTTEERAVLVTETYNREMHMGGFGQWLSNTGSSVAETLQALRTVGAEGNAGLLQRAAEVVPPGWSEDQPLDVRVRLLEPVKSILRSLDDSFFALQREEDLTTLVARFVRQNRARCPALA